MTLDIMMPFYGRIDHFKLAVRSVLAQTDPDWRLVIVDDVYPDLSAGEWAAAIDDPRVTYLRNEENLRPSRNYRKCVGLMENPFAVIMGCDDLMLPGYVARVNALTARFPNAAVIQPGVEVIDSDGALHRPLADRVKGWYEPRGSGIRVIEGETMARSLLRGNWTYFPSLVWNVERLRRHEFRTDLDVVQDLAMLLELAKDGGSLVVDDDIVFRYRRHAESVSAVTAPDGSKFAQERVVFGEAARDLAALGWHGAARAARLHLTSRLHAAADLPKAVLARDASGFRSLARHTFGGSKAD
ncbi:glycosyltransferase family 2 protein [Agromyces sp. NPDC058110]|uniref:glycosyltransferase family 2 protein n=1 Tax=Agromyces sp. NPDC058110 TaxID=3346345 RepID=UPI0036DD57A9